MGVLTYGGEGEIKLREGDVAVASAMMGESFVGLRGFCPSVFFFRFIWRMKGRWERGLDFGWDEAEMDGYLKDVGC